MSLNLLAILIGNSSIVNSAEARSLFRFLDFFEALSYNTNNTMNSAASASSDNKAFWRSLFDAQSIAVIGANDIAGSWGYDALRTAIASGRPAFAVNPNIPQILGLPTYKSIGDIPSHVDLAIIVVPAAIVPGVLRQCVQKKVGAAVIISAGFAEVDEAGAKLQAELEEISRLSGLRFVGPNCLGHTNAHNLVGSAGVGSRAQAGPLAVISQSGTLGASIAMNAAAHGIGISKFISSGNEASVHLEDYLEYLATDNDTQIIAAYVEGLREGRRFFNLAKQISTRKPILVIKTGTTEHSSLAARSHTGALAGSDVIYNAAFRQSGVIRAVDEEELCDVAVALLNQPLPHGNRVGILTMGGGFGVVTAEACEKEGLRIASLSQTSLEKLNAILPPRWSHGNPVDLVGIKHMGEDPTAISCLNILMADPNIDILISLLPPAAPLMGPGGGFTAEQFGEMQSENLKRLNLLREQVEKTGKPLFLLRRFTPQQPFANRVGPGESKRIPEYSNTLRVARVLRHLVSYRRYLDQNND
jgi:acyl-CoA synthetase (NDP forming)